MTEYSAGGNWVSYVIFGGSPEGGGSSEEEERESGRATHPLCSWQAGRVPWRGGTSFLELGRILGDILYLYSRRYWGPATSFYTIVQEAGQCMVELMFGSVKDVFDFRNGAPRPLHPANLSKAHRGGVTHSRRCAVFQPPPLERAPVDPGGARKR